MKSNTNTTKSTRRANLEQWAESIIDSVRFHDGMDRILARHEAVDSIFPSADELAARGVDTVVLARVINKGLNVAEFGKAIVNGLGLSEFGDLVRSMKARRDTTDLNAALELFNESADERAAQPDPVLRSLAAVGVHDVCFA